MTHNNQNQNFYGGDYTWKGENPQGYSYDFNQPEFGMDQQFGTFDYNASAGSYPTENPYLTTSSSAYSGSILTPTPASMPFDGTSESFEDEPPLLEELGINFDHIMQKTVAVLNPFKETNAAILQESDLAGPLVFCMTFGSFLLFTGKVHFGYIYGIGVLGCISMYLLLNLMSGSGVSVGCTISVLGYCLLPMVVLSGVSILLSLKGMLGTVLAIFIVLWCSLSASKLFVTALAMDHQQPLVAYPCALLYGVFALLTIF